jgi:hypothetical protein
MNVSNINIGEIDKSKLQPLMCKTPETRSSSKFMALLSSISEVSLSKVELKLAYDSGLLASTAPGSNTRIGVISNFLVWVEFEEYPRPKKTLILGYQDERNGNHIDPEEKLGFYHATKMVNLVGCEARCSRLKGFPHFITIMEKWSSQVLQKLEFINEASLLNFRNKLSRALVVFDDFPSKYNLMVDRGRNNYILESHGTGKIYQAQFWELPNGEELSNPGEQLSTILREARVLEALQSTNLAPKFQELSNYNRKVGIIQEYLDGVSFGEWFRHVWCCKLGQEKGGPEITQLMLDLTLFVQQLHEAKICHNGISKKTLMVKVFADAQSARSKWAEEVEIDISSTLHGQPNTARVGFQQSNYLQKMQKLLTIQSGELKSDRYHQYSLGTGRAKLLGEFQFYLINFSEACLIPSTEVPARFGHLIKPSLTCEAHYTKLNSYYSKDIYDLGVMFLEMLYGIDLMIFLRTNLSVIHGASSQTAPARMLSNKEPLYNIDSRVIGILVLMIDADPKQRPSLERIIDNLQTQIKDYNSRRDLKTHSLSKSPRNNLYWSNMSLEDLESSIARGNSLKGPRGTKFSGENYKQVMTPITNKANKLAPKLNQHSHGTKPPLPENKNFSSMVKSAQVVHDDLEEGSKQKNLKSEGTGVEAQTLSGQMIRGLSLFSKTPRKKEKSIISEVKLEPQHSISPEFIAKKAIGGLSLSSFPRNQTQRFMNSTNTPAVIYFGREQFKPNNKLQPIRLEPLRQRTKLSSLLSSARRQNSSVG